MRYRESRNRKDIRNGSRTPRRFSSFSRSLDRQTDRSQRRDNLSIRQFAGDIRQGMDQTEVVSVNLYMTLT